MDTIAAAARRPDKDRLNAYGRMIPAENGPGAADGKVWTSGARVPGPQRPTSRPAQERAAAAPGGRRLRWHLLGFAAALILPVLAFAVGVAIEYGGAQRARLEGEARAVARELDAAVDRELSALLAAAQTLAASPALRARDLPAFGRQASEVAAARGVIVVLRAPSGRQLVNTATLRGAPLPERTEAGGIRTRSGPRWRARSSFRTCSKGL